MANPKFRNINDAADEYTWSDLPLDGVAPVTQDRDYQNFDDVHRNATGEIVGVADRGRLRPKQMTIECTEANMIEFRKFALYGAAWLYPDSGVGTRHQVVWEPPEFNAERLSGGRYRFSFALMEVHHS